MINQKHKTKGKDTTWQGVPCTSDDARKWDQLQKQLEQDDLGFKRAVSYKTDELVEGEWADVSTINDATLDRESEVVDPKGCDLTHFNKNSTVTLNHDYEGLPVGRAAWTRFCPNKRKPTCIKMKTLYAPRPKDYPEEAMWKPEEVWGLIRQGFLNGKSVGFIRLDAREPTKKEIDDRPELATCRRIISKWSLLEVAVCSIPCNPSALIDATAKGLVSKSVVDALGIPIQQIKETRSGMSNYTSLWLFDQIKPKPKAKETLPKFYRKWNQTEMDLTRLLSEDEIIDRLTGKP